MNTDRLGICIKDFNDLHIVKEKVRRSGVVVLFLRGDLKRRLPNRCVRSL